MQGGRRYLARKFVARHRVGVVAAGAALALLLAALAGTLWSLNRAQAARAAEATRFEQVRSLARYLLFDLNERLKRVAGNTGARANLANEAQSYLTMLAAGSGTREDLKLETAQGLIQLARIQGSPNEPNLGEIDKARANFLAAQELLNALPNTSESAKAPALAQAQALHALILLNDEARQVDAAKGIAASARTLEKVAPVDRTISWFEARRTFRQVRLDFADISATPEQFGTLADQLDADIAQWPKAMRQSRVAALDRATAAYYRALKESESGDRVDFGLPLFLAAERHFDALSATDPNDPVMLLIMTNFLKDAFVAASRSETAGHEDISNRLINKANNTVERLIAIDDRDQSVRNQSASIKEGLSQNLRDHDQFVEAISLQQRVVALRVSNIGPNRKARTVSDLGFSQMILGIISRDAGNRTLACESWSAAEVSISELERRNQLTGFMKDFLPGLRSKNALCKSKTPLSGLMTPLR
jgi:eukaryotic-like serine/threonine-protein kinase